MKLVAIVLAAGRATRFGSDKLSALLHGDPLLFHAIRAARAAPVERVIVVARSGLAIGKWNGLPSVDAIRLDSPALSDSLKAGIAAAGQSDGAFIFLGDMPLVPHRQAHRLVRLLPGNYAALPRYRDRPGHPVLLSAGAFADLNSLSGDEGAGRLLKTRSDVAYDESPDPAVQFDVDHPEDLQSLPGRIKPEEN